MEATRNRYVFENRLDFNLFVFELLSRSIRYDARTHVDDCVFSGYVEVIGTPDDDEKASKLYIQIKNNNE